MPFFDHSAAAGGNTGLFVVPSNALTTTPVYITHTSGTQLALGYSFTGSTSAVTSYSASSMIFGGVGSDNKLHVYGVDLSNIAAAPTPVQLTTLTLNDTSQLCNYTQVQADDTDPKSLFVVLEVPGPTGTCGTGDVYEIVRYTDTATATPAQVALTSTDIHPLYTNGKLSGIVALNTTTSNLLFYVDSTFTAATAKTLASGVTSMSNIYDSNGSSTSLAGSSYIFFDVSSGGTEALYRVTASGTATKVYTATGTLTTTSTSDTANLYFADSGASSLSVNQEPLSGASAPTAIYTMAVSTTTSLDLIGSTGAKLVMDKVVTASDGSQTHTFGSIPTGQVSTAPAAIGTAVTGYVNAFLAGPSGASAASYKLFVSARTTNTSTNPSTVSYSTLVFDPTAGSVVQSQLANSRFQQGASAFLNSVVQFKGITDTSGGFGGSTPYSIDGGSLAATPFKTPNGSNYVVPTSDSAGLLPYSNAVGEVIIIGTSGQPGAAAYDLSQYLVVPLISPLVVM